MTTRAGTALPSAEERALIARAKAGDKRASSDLFRALQPTVRAIARRFVGQPDDVDDLVQDALVEGLTALTEQSEEQLATQPLGARIEAAATRLVLAFLAEQRRWRVAAQIQLQEACTGSDMLEDVVAALADEDLTYDVKEHVAFCFTAVGRSLPLEQLTAVMLVDALGFDLERAAELAGLDLERLRQYLDESRRVLADTYDRLCRLSSESGACDQCRGLRDAAPEGRKGPPIDGREGVDLTGATSEDRLHRRLRVVRDADIDRGTTQTLHDLLFRMLAKQETNRASSAKKDDDIPKGRARWEPLQSVNN